MRFTRSMLASALLCASGLAVAMTGTSAHADTLAILPITSFGQIVVDAPHGHLFLSQGSDTANSVIVTDLRGNQIATIDGQHGVRGMALSADGRTLYAALASDDAVSAIDAATLTETARYPLGNGISPVTLALQSGKLWVGYNVVTNGSWVAGESAIGNVGLEAASPAFALQALPGNWYYAPYLTADPGNSGALVAGYGNQAASFDVSTSPVTVRAQPPVPADVGCTFDREMAVVPGGGQLLASCGGTGFATLNTADLSVGGGSYSTNGPYPLAVAVSPNGMVAVGNLGASQSAVYVYQQGAATPQKAYPAGYASSVVAGGLAWSADGSRLVAVTTYREANGKTGYDLQVLYPQLQTSTLYVEGPYRSSAVVGATNEIDGSLTIGTSPAPLGTEIDIVRTDVDSGDTTQFTTTTGSNGEYMSRDTLPAVGTYTYEVSYAGDAATAPASYNNYVVTVSPLQPWMDLNGPSTATYGLPIEINGDLEPSGTTLDPPPQTTIDITRTVAVGTTAAHLTATTDVGGLFSLTDTPPAPGTYTYTATYSGSPAIKSASATYTVTVTADTAVLSIGGTSSATLGQAVSLTGNLAFDAGNPATGTQVAMTRTVSGSAATANFTASTDANGNFTVQDKPSAPGNYAYTATYAGSAVTTPATATRLVTVKRVPSLTVTTSASLIGYGGTVTVTAHLGTTQSLRTVVVMARTAGSSATRAIKSAAVDSRGNLTVSVPVANSTTFTVAFAGDSLDTPVSASRTVPVLARVTASLSGYYTSTLTGGTTYRVYRHTATLKDAAAVAPNKHGQCVQLQVQKYSGGAWRAVATTACGHLDASSRASLSLKLSSTGQYRIRVNYVHSSSDTSNVSAFSAWLYYKVVS